MTDDKLPNPLIAWVFAALIAAPFVGGAWAIWAQPFGLSSSLAAWLLSLHTAIVVIATGGLRIVFAARRGGLAGPTLVVSVLPPLVAIGTFLASGVIGFHWVFALLLGALAVQGAWDITGYGVPELIRRMRPIVFVAALLSLLAALIGA